MSEIATSAAAIGAAPARTIGDGYDRRSVIVAMHDAEGDLMSIASLTARQARALAESLRESAAQVDGESELAIMPDARVGRA